MNLVEIKQLIKEFYNPVANNERKREIERRLLEIQRENTSWKFSLAALNDPSLDDQLRMFFFHCLENVIHQQWFQLSLDDRQQIREHIWVLYRNCSKDGSSSRLYRNKLAQLIAVFGKRQFPSGEHETYDKQIRALLEDQSTFSLGVILLRVNCEEILSTRSDVTILARKSFSEAISKSFASFVPILSQSLAVIVDSSHRNPEFVALTLDIFTCIQAIIQCDILDDQFLTHIVGSFFAIAVNDAVSGDPQLGVAAMETLIEIFTRQRMFRTHDVVAKGTVELLKAVEKSSSCKSSQYEGVFVQLLQAASKHMTVQWWAKVSVCSLETYLEALWSYTTSTKNDDPMLFCDKLAVWMPILSFYSENAESVSFPESLINVAKLTMSRMMIQYNAKLEDIYGYADDGEEEEWTTYVKACLEIICVLSQIQPVAMFELISSEVGKAHGPLEIFRSLTTRTHTNFLTMINDAQNVVYLRTMIRDLGTQSQILARTLPIIKANVDPDAAQLQQRLEELVTKFIGISHLLLVHIAQIPIDLASKELILFKDIFDTEAQLFNSNIYLFSISSTLTTGRQGESSVIVDVFDNAVQFILRAIAERKANASVNVLLASLAEFLKGIILELRPKYLMIEGRSIEALLKCDFSGGCVPKAVERTLCRTVFCCFLLTWKNVQQQEQTRRVTIAQEYVQFIGRPLLESNSSEVLEAFEDVLEFFCNENSFAKQILAQALRPISEKTFCIFKTFHMAKGGADPKTLERILRYFLSLLRTLQTQLSVDMIKELLLAFIEHCKQGFGDGVVLNHLLKIFLNIVKQHTHSSFVLLQDIVKLSIEEVAPLLFTNAPSDESLLHLYEVFDAILQERWQFFFKSQVLRGFSPGASDDTTIAPYEEPHHAPYIAFILNAYGHALGLHSHLDLTRLTLQSLIMTDEKHKLFQTLYFQRNFLSSYQTAIVQCLGAPEGIINFDLLVTVLYKMSHKQMSSLTGMFSELYKAAKGGVNGTNIHLDADLPTFAFQVSNMIHDLRLTSQQTFVS